MFYISSSKEHWTSTLRYTVGKASISKRNFVITNTIQLHAIKIQLQLEEKNNYDTLFYNSILTSLYMRIDYPMKKYVSIH